MELRTKDRAMNAHYTLNELQIGIDVGSLNHSIAISDGFGNIINLDYAIEIPSPHKKYEFKKDF